MSDGIALVTGAVGDIGRASAVRLAQAGMTVVINDILEESAGQGVVDEIVSNGGKAEYIRADVSNRCEVNAMFDRVLDQFGGLDVCFSNAGVVTNVAFLEVTEDQWDFVLGVNLKGGFHVGQEAARRMVATKTRGKIIFTGSFVQDVPHAFNSNYCASKGGLLMLAKTMALELAPYGITVNLVAPGIVDGGLSKQEMTEKPHLRPIYAKSVPLGSMQTPDQIADVVEFLTSERAAYLTGTSILTDGGCSLFKFGVGS